MENYQKVRVKLTNTQLNKLRSAAKNKTETMLRLNNKKIEDEKLSHEFFLTRQTSVFANNISTDI